MRLVYLLSLTVLVVTMGLFPPAAPVQTSEPRVEVLFCQVYDCAAALVYYLEHAESVCAFFDVDEPRVLAVLHQKQPRIVTDNQYGLQGSFVHPDTRAAYMHNKFCVFDQQIVWTGSYNPTVRGTQENDNNVVIIHSTELAQRYLAEFEEMWNGDFGGGKPTQPLQGKVQVYFCPEDWCATKISEVLRTAQSTVYFATFSFTHEGLARQLVQLAERGVLVEGVMERTQQSQWSQYTYLESQGVAVMLDNNSAFMHHKFFVIDNATVITGSFNPTKNGDFFNDENVVIIRDAGVAEAFLGEYQRLSS